MDSQDRQEVVVDVDKQPEDHDLLTSTPTNVTTSSSLSYDDDSSTKGSASKITKEASEDDGAVLKSKKKEGMKNSSVPEEEKDNDKAAIDLTTQATEPNAVLMGGIPIGEVVEQGNGHTVTHLAEDTEEPLPEDDENPSFPTLTGTTNTSNGPHGTEANRAEVLGGEREGETNNDAPLVRASIVRPDESLELEVAEELRQELQQELQESALDPTTGGHQQAVVLGELVDDDDKLLESKSENGGGRSRNFMMILFVVICCLILVVIIPVAVVVGINNNSSSSDPQRATTTRAWDCNGGACGCGYQPNETKPEDPELFDPAHCYSNGLFVAPVNNPYKASFYGTASISEVLGGDWWQGPGCGKCWKLTGESILDGSVTTIVVRGNNFCSPFFNLCADGNPHFSIAAPGFDSAFAGCDHLEPEYAEGLRSCINWPLEPCDCSLLEHPTLRAGCENFLALQWVDPTVDYESVVCPEELLVTHCETDGSWPLEPIPDNCAYFPDTSG